MPAFQRTLRMAMPAFAIQRTLRHATERIIAKRNAAALSDAKQDALTLLDTTHLGDTPLNTTEDEEKIASMPIAEEVQHDIQPISASGLTDTPTLKNMSEVKSSDVVNLPNAHFPAPE